MAAMLSGKVCMTSRLPSQNTRVAVSNIRSCSVVAPQQRRLTFPVAASAVVPPDAPDGGELPDSAIAFDRQPPHLFVVPRNASRLRAAISALGAKLNQLGFAVLRVKDLDALGSALKLLVLAQKEAMAEGLQLEVVFTPIKSARVIDQAAIQGDAHLSEWFRPIQIFVKYAAAQVSPDMNEPLKSGVTSDVLKLGRAMYSRLVVSRRPDVTVLTGSLDSSLKVVLAFIAKRGSFLRQGVATVFTLLPSEGLVPQPVPMEVDHPSLINPLRCIFVIRAVALPSRDNIAPEEAAWMQQPPAPSA